MNEPTARLTAVEATVLVGAAVAAGLGGVVWAGAVLSAVLSGGRLEGGLVDAIRAVVELPDHLSEPRLAWPSPNDRALLPDAGVYWASTLAVLAVVLGMVWLGSRWWASRARGRVRLGVDTRARFANVHDLTPLIVSHRVPTGRFVLGEVHGRLVATENRHTGEGPIAWRRVRRRIRRGDRGSVAVIGPSRSGKTANVIAGLLEWDGPAVVVSIKRDLIDATEKARSQRGETTIFDPSGVSGIRSSRLARWSPLRAADTPRGAQKAAAALAASIPRSGVDGGTDYWVKQAEILLSGLLAAAALDTSCTMADIAEWVFGKEIPTGGHPTPAFEILVRAKEEGSPQEKLAAGTAMLHLNAVWMLDERVRSSVYATVQTVVQAWFDPAVQLSATIENPKRQRFVDLSWLTGDDAANTLYLVAPLDDQRRLAPVLGGLLGDLKDQAYQGDVAGSPLRKPLLMVIDEAGNMPLAWLPEVAATCAGIGILLVTIWQSKAQLDAAYGRLSDSVLTNHLTKVVFSGCSDAATLDYVSRLLGDEEVARRTLSYDVAGGLRRRSVSESVGRESLTPFHLLRQVRPGEAVLIHGTLPPAHLHARRWWADRHLRALSDGVDPDGRWSRRKRLQVGQ